MINDLDKLGFKVYRMITNLATNQSSEESGSQGLPPGYIANHPFLIVDSKSPRSVVMRSRNRITAHKAHWSVSSCSESGYPLFDEYDHLYFFSDDPGEVFHRALNDVRLGDAKVYENGNFRNLSYPDIYPCSECMRNIRDLYASGYFEKSSGEEDIEPDGGFNLMA